MPPASPPPGAGPGAPGLPGEGDRIGPYVLGRQLGRGGMGIVFEAVDEVLKRRVALKIISPHLANDRGVRARFTREAQAQASLDSPHVVTVFAHGAVDGALYIATQLIPDGDLGAMIRSQGAPPPRIAVDVIAQIATGLADAHATGLVHRDIKPANVLLRVRGQDVSAYLADFGIARRVDAVSGLTTDGMAVGTPSYMAPELHTGGAPGPTSDVYSLGCLLWAALLGRAPYAGTSDYAIVAAHVSGPIPQLVAAGGFEREVNRVLRTALAKDPGERYPSAGAMRDDLRAVLHHHRAPETVVAASGSGTAQRPALTGPVSPAPPTAPFPAPRREPVPQPVPQPVSRPMPSAAPHYLAPPPTTGSRRRTGWVVAGVVALVLVVGGVVGFLVVRDGNGDPGGGSSAGPTEEATDEHGLDPEEQEAVRSIAEGLTADGDVEPSEAECVARGLVKKHGLDGLVEKGLLDENHEVVDTDSTDIDAGIWGDVLSIGLSCILTASPTT